MLHLRFDGEQVPVSLRDILGVALVAASIVLSGWLL